MWRAFLPSIFWGRGDVRIRSPEQWPWAAKARRLGSGPRPSRSCPLSPKSLPELDFGFRKRSIGSDLGERVRVRGLPRAPLTRLPPSKLGFLGQSGATVWGKGDGGLCGVWPPHPNPLPQKIDGQRLFCVEGVSAVNFLGERGPDLLPLGIDGWRVFCLEGVSAVNFLGERGPDLLPLGIDGWRVFCVEGVSAVNSLGERGRPNSPVGGAVALGCWVRIMGSVGAPTAAGRIGWWDRQSRGGWFR